MKDVHTHAESNSQTPCVPKYMSLINHIQLQPVIRSRLREFLSVYFQLYFYHLHSRTLLYLTYQTLRHPTVINETSRPLLNIVIRAYNLRIIWCQIPTLMILCFAPYRDGT